MEHVCVCMCAGMSQAGMMGKQRKASMYTLEMGRQAVAGLGGAGRQWEAGQAGPSEEKASMPVYNLNM